MKNKKNIIIAVICTIVSVVYTFLVKNVDVKSIGPNNSSVGFSTINEPFKNLVGYSKSFYKISELLGYLLLLLVVIYGCIGLYQLVKRKSLFKVDRQIIVLGCFYVLMMIVYVFFEKCVINYRPVILDGELEASFPSSHTLLSLCVGLSSLIVSKNYFNKKYIKTINIITIALMSLVLVTRILSGAHWISDIIGGIIISFTLLSYFKLAYEYKKIE